jgi:ParB-like nuclease domain
MLAPTNLVALEDIVVDPRTYLRASQHSDVVSSYADAMEEGVGFPPVVLFREGSSLYLADGHLRVRAAKRAGIEALPAVVRPGSIRDAVLFACGANGTHGLPRTNKDKRIAVKALLGDLEWSKLSNNKIASACHVSSVLVGQMRGAVATVQVTRAGKTYAMTPRRNHPVKAKSRDYFAGRDDQKREDAELADKMGLGEFARLLREGAPEPKRAKPPGRSTAQLERALAFARSLGPRIGQLREGKASWEVIADQLTGEKIPTTHPYSRRPWTGASVRSIYERYQELSAAVV